MIAKVKKINTITRTRNIVNDMLYPRCPISVKGFRILGYNSGNKGSGNKRST